MNAELNSSSGARLILVTPGSFVMGSPQSEPGHMYWEGEREVTLSNAFYLGATPVTQRQYARATGDCCLVANARPFVRKLPKVRRQILVTRQEEPGTHRRSPDPCAVWP